MDNHGDWWKPFRVAHSCPTFQHCIETFPYKGVASLIPPNISLYGHHNAWKPLWNRGYLKKSPVLNYCTMFPAHYQVFIGTGRVSDVRQSNGGTPARQTSNQVENGLSQIGNSDKSWRLNCWCSNSAPTEGADNWKLKHLLLFQCFFESLWRLRMSSIHIFLPRNWCCITSQRIGAPHAGGLLQCSRNSTR